MEISAQNSPQYFTINMPVSGTLKKIPQAGEIISKEPDNITSWKGEIERNSFEIEKSESLIQYTTSAFVNEAKQLKSFDLIDSVNKFRQRYSNSNELSLNPVEDLYSIYDSRYENRIQEVYNLLNNILWHDRFEELPLTVPDEALPNLDLRIDNLLNLNTIKFCSSLVSLWDSDVKKIAIKAISDKIRWENNIDLQFNTIRHPSIPFQVLNINDPVLYTQHTIYSSVEDFEEHSNAFISKALNYWDKVAENKLYNTKDIEALQKWGISSNLKVSEKLRKSQKELNLTLFKIELFRKISIAIADIGLNCFINSSWPFPSNEDNENSKWAANNGVSAYQYEIESLADNEIILTEENADEYDNLIAQKKIDLVQEFISQHSQTWLYLRRYALKYYLIDYSNLLEKIAGYSISDRDLMLLTIKSVTPEIVNHMMAENIEFKLKHLFGGTILRFNKQSFMFVNLPEIGENSININEALKIKNSLLKNPLLYQENLQNLNSWREGFEKRFNKVPLNSPEIVKNSFKERFNETYWDLIEIQTTINNIKQINNGYAIYYSMLEKLNSTQLGEGSIDIPADTKVVSVFSKQDEYVKSGQPILNLKYRFVSKALSILKNDIFLQLKIEKNTFWKIGLNNKLKETNKIFYGCFIENIQPYDLTKWAITMRLFPYIKPSISNISNLPSILPISSRYLDPVLSYVTESILDDLEQIFTKAGPVNVNFLEKIQ